MKLCGGLSCGPLARVHLSSHEARTWQIWPCVCGGALVCLCGWSSDFPVATAVFSASDAVWMFYARVRPPILVLRGFFPSSSRPCLFGGRYFVRAGAASIKCLLPQPLVNRFFASQGCLGFSRWLDPSLQPQVRTSYVPTRRRMGRRARSRCFQIVNQFSRLCG